MHQPPRKKNPPARINKPSKSIAMIQIGQKIDDLIDDFEFEVYQNNQIKKDKFSNYAGKWAGSN